MLHRFFSCRDQRKFEIDFFVSLTTLFISIRFRHLSMSHHVLNQCLDEFLASGSVHCVLCQLDLITEQKSILFFSV